ncbi:sulfurtransferase [Lysobacter sp. A3-1-A15]|uniref:sulfurtransferase n=1 Tax=Novilysobacter viscosus TaxID=3098602 RepID=UPI002ED9995B
MTSSDRTGWTTLVDPDALAAALVDGEVVVVDARFSLADPGAGEDAYRMSHVAGARYAHLDRDLSGPPGSGEGRHPWPAAEAFGQVLSAWGVTPGTQVVAYDDAGGALAAARLWCLMRMAGHQRVAVLDGGWAGWQQRGLPVDSHVPPPGRSGYRVQFDDAALLDSARLQRHLAAGRGVVDARAPERFSGDVEPIDRVAGHVPGAVNRPFSDNLDDGRFKPPARLADEFGTLLAGRPASDWVAMCGSGVTACHHLLAMAHAGLPGAGLATGSWSGWIEDPARPVARGPA